ncbi:MAG: hypothetical protein QW783_03545 [Candidatus Micrarchaeia archaeon]
MGSRKKSKSKSLKSKSLRYKISSKKNKKKQKKKRYILQQFAQINQYGGPVSKYDEKTQQFLNRRLTELENKGYEILISSDRITIIMQEHQAKSEELFLRKKGVNASAVGSALVIEAPFQEMSKSEGIMKKESITEKKNKEVTLYMSRSEYNTIKDYVKDNIMTKDNFEQNKEEIFGKINSDTYRKLEKAFENNDSIIIKAETFRFTAELKENKETKN